MGILAASAALAVTGLTAPAQAATPQLLHYIVTTYYYSDATYSTLVGVTVFYDCPGDEVGVQRSGVSSSYNTTETDPC